MKSIWLVGFHIEEVVGETNEETRIGFDARLFRSTPESGSLAAAGRARHGEDRNGIAVRIEHICTKTTITFDKIKSKLYF